MDMPAAAHMACAVPPQISSVTVPPASSVGQSKLAEPANQVRSLSILLEHMPGAHAQLPLTP